MKAYRFQDFTSLDDLKLRDEDDPPPQRGEVLVRVHAGEGLQDVARMIATAGIKPVIDRVFDFEDAKDAYAHRFALREGDHPVLLIHPIVQTHIGNITI